MAIAVISVLPLRDTLEMTTWQCTHGVSNLEAISMDTWNMDQLFPDRPGKNETQLVLLSHRANLPLYPQW
jgi:hypothetical protein